jgi:phage repressor protein C with HTH and peptisase S24 domain
MARRKNQPEAVRVKCYLAERLRQVRVDLYGERGGSEMARRLGLPVRTWYNYEAGVTVPAEVLLRFVELTSVEPMWLLHGRGPQYRDVPPFDPKEDSVEALLRTALRRLEQNPPAIREERSALNGDPPAIEDEADVILLGVEGKGHDLLTEESGPRHLAARREWLAAKRDLRCVRVEGDAMAPIIADGALVAYSDSDDDPNFLDGKLVVAWIDGKPLVRWLRLSGHYALLRAENPSADPGTLLLDLEGDAQSRRVRRVLGISTPH